jgi:hypothetical protein
MYLFFHDRHPAICSWSLVAPLACLRLSLWLRARRAATANDDEEEADESLVKALALDVTGLKEDGLQRAL